MSLRAVGVLAISMNCVHAWGQFVISAKSGLIDHVEGLVLLSGDPVVSKSGAHREMRDGSELRAEDGRAEVLLNPGVFLRVGEHSTVRMVSNDLADTRIEFVAGARFDAAFEAARGGDGDRSQEAAEPGRLASVERLEAPALPRMRQDNEPPAVGPVGGLGDIGTALFATIGILAALRHRDQVTVTDERGWRGRH